MKDARRRPRDVVDQFLPVMHRDTGELVGYLTDVNVDGGMLESEIVRDDGERLPLLIELSEPIADKRHIEVDARCVWSRKARNAVFHHMGFQFENVDIEERRRIAELAERYRLNLSR